MPFSGNLCRLGTFFSHAPNLIRRNKPPQQQTAATPAKAAAETALAPASPITVTTDTVKAVIDEKSGDLRQLTLLQYKATGDEHKPFVLFNDGRNTPTLPNLSF